MGTPRFNFTNKEDINYNPYGKKFTERQLRIINGQTVDKLRLNEITKVIKKAEKLGDESLAMEIFELYEDMIMGYNTNPPKYTFEEAVLGLRKLTPAWIKNW